MAIDRYLYDEKQKQIVEADLNVDSICWHLAQNLVIIRIHHNQKQIFLLL